MANVRFSVKLADFGKYEARVGRKIRPAVASALRATARRSVRRLKAMSSRRGIRDQGAFAAGWTWRQLRWSAVLVFNGAPHAIFVEIGRGAGLKPPPVGAIAAWVSRKFGSADLAFVVARSIGRRGIRARPVMTSGEFRAAARRIYSTELKGHLDRAWEEAAR